MAVLDPSALSVRSKPGWAWARRAALFGSLLLAVAAPAAHLAHNAALAGTAAARAAGTAPSAVTALLVQLPVDAEPPVVGAPWTVAVFGVEILDPLAAASLLVTGSLTARALGGALFTLIAVAVLGRFFCGWICPYALVARLADRTRALLRRLGIPLLDLRLPARTAFVVLGVLLVVQALLALQLAPLLYPPAVIHRALARLFMDGSLGVGVALVGAAFVFDTTVSRTGFCRSLCPGGAMFRLIGVLSPVGVQLDVPKCTRCTACDVVCPMGQSPMNGDHDSGCDRCGRCVTACPTAALDLVAITRRARPKTAGAA